MTKPAPETMVDQRIRFVGVRMSEELDALIKDRAARDGRSVSKQIVYYLENVADLKDESDQQPQPGRDIGRYRT